MAYNQENKLRRILDVQRTFKEKYVKGQTIEYAFKEYIKPAYRISRATFYKWMKVNAEKELRDLEKNLQGKKRLEQIEFNFDV